MARRPRDQDKAIGRQEGTPKRRARDRKKRMNINDKMREWQNALDGGGASDLRRAIREALEQLRQALANEPVPDKDQERADDLTAAHYLEVCAKLEAIRGSVEASEQAGRKRMDLTVLKEILEAGRDA